MSNERMKREKHPLADRLVVLDTDDLLGYIKSGALFLVKDWAENVLTDKWRKCMSRSMPAFIYGTRVAGCEGHRGLPEDDEVVFGYIDGLPYLVHQSELGQDNG